MDLYNEAISDFNVALQLNNMDAYSYYVRGAAYLMNKVQGSAIKDFVSASIIDESYVNKISESTNINLMSVMDILKKLPYLSEQETSNLI